MKRWMKICLPVLACVLLCGCSRLIPSEYLQVRTHSQPQSEAAQASAVRVEDLTDLRRAIRNFVQSGVEHGVIRAQAYDGDLKADLNTASYEISREDPLGAYAVEDMSHRISRIVSYYEAEIDITFRRTAQQIKDVQYVSFMSAHDTEQHVHDAIDSGTESVAFHFARYIEQDFEQIVRDYYDANPTKVLEMPKVDVTSYPETGISRVIELQFSYQSSPTELAAMRKAIDDNLTAAAVYVRYRENEQERADLLFTYLKQRFAYRQGESPTPVYAFLCEGLANSEAAAKTWQELCERIGLTCHTVRGTRDGAEYWWNIVRLEGQYYHVDILSDLLGLGNLTKRTDTQMEGYAWDTAQFPPTSQWPQE